jgi:hypothetical protein
VSSDREDLAELEREGLVRSGETVLPKGFLDAPRPKPAGPSVTEALLEERRQGR